MRFTLVPTLLLGAAVSAVAAAPQFERLAASDGDTVLAALQKQAEDALKKQQAAEQVAARRGACHLGNAAIRRDWYVFPSFDTWSHFHRRICSARHLCSGLFPLLSPVLGNIH